MYDNISTNLYAKRNSWYWIISYQDVTDKRKQKWVNTGLPVKGNNERKAKGMLYKILDEWLPKLDIGEVYEDISFEEASYKWLGGKKKQIQITTYNNYRRILNQMLLYFGKYKVKELTKSIIQRYFDDLNLKRSSLLPRQNLISQIIAPYVGTLLNENITANIILPRKIESQISFYTKDEIEKLLLLFKDHWLFVLVAMASFCGMRISEIIGLTWDNVDFKNKEIRIVQVAYISSDRKQVIKKELKSKKSMRTLPMISTIEEILEEELNRQKTFEKDFGLTRAEFVCINKKNEWIKLWTAQTSFKHWIKKSKLPYISIHGLRHSCATLLYNIGIDPWEIMQYLGHSNISMTQVYTHLSSENLRKTATALNNAFSK